MNINNDYHENQELIQLKETVNGLEQRLNIVDERFEALEEDIEDTMFFVFENKYRNYNVCRIFILSIFILSILCFFVIIACYFFLKRSL